MGNANDVHRCPQTVNSRSPITCTTLLVRHVGRKESGTPAMCLVPFFLPLSFSSVCLPLTHTHRTHHGDINGSLSGYIWSWDTKENDRSWVEDAACACSRRGQAAGSDKCWYTRDRIAPSRPWKAKNCFNKAKLPSSMSVCCCKTCYYGWKKSQSHSNWPLGAKSYWYTIVFIRYLQGRSPSMIG